MSTQTAVVAVVIVLLTASATVVVSGVVSTPHLSAESSSDVAPAVDSAALVQRTDTPTEIDACTVIDQPGTYVLTQDIVSDPATTPAGFVCLLVTVPGVTIDGDGHRLRSSGRTDVGISAGPSPGPTVVKNLELSGWDEAIESADVVGRVQPSVGRVDLVNVVATDNGVGLHSDGGPIHVTDSEFSENRQGLAMSENVVTIARVVASGNARSGLSASQLSGSITDSEFSHNGVDGIQLAISGPFEFRDLVVADNGGRGMSLIETYEVTLVDSHLTGNGEEGLFLNGVGIDSRIESNTISGNDIGVSLDFTDLVFTRNRVENNAEAGLVVEGTNDAVVYDNLFSNDVNVQLAPLPPFASTPVVTWSVDPRPELNVVDGAFVAGNFYGSPDGDGFSQTCVDEDVDTLCDDPLELFDGNVDEYPLAQPSVPADEPPTQVAPEDLREVRFALDCGPLTGGQSVEFGYYVLHEAGVPADAASQEWSNEEVLDVVFDSPLGPAVKLVGVNEGDLLWTADPGRQVVRVFADTRVGLRSCTCTVVE